MSVAPGQPFSHYRILSKLGSGGMGTVYLAEDESLGRKVALKFLLPEGDTQASTLRRFLQEARSAAAIDHPFACKVYETGEVEGRPFIAMEYVDGESLAERLKRGPLPIGDALRLGREIAEALAKAHQRGIVHRDLKPANVMLDSEGHAKVMDFGLAKQVSPLGPDDSGIDTATLLTVPGTVLGTLGYMAPEQIRGGAGDRRSDAFSFGIVLYEMLSGVHPFRKDTPADTVAAILGADPVPLDALPDTAASIVQSLLEKDPDQRSADLSATADALEHAASSSLHRRHSRPWPIRPAILVVAALVIAVCVVLGWRFVVGERSSRSPDVAALKRSEYASRASALMQNFSDPEDLRASIELWHKVLDQDPDSAPALAGSATARALIAWNSTPDPQMLNLAEQEAERAIELDPSLPESYVALTVIYQLRGLVETAEKMSERAIELAPRNPWTLQVRSRFLMDRFGRFAEAEELARRAVEIDPDFFPGWFQLGWARFELERLDEAESDFRRAITLRPDFAAGYFGLGVVYNAAADYESALAALDEALAIDPGSVQALLYRGVSLHDLNRPEEARESFRAVVTGNPDHMLAPVAMVYEAVECDRLGLVSERDARIREAESVFKSNPDLWPFLFGLADIAALRGDRDEALDWLEQAIRKGMRSVQLVAQDPALQSLRDEPRMQSILDQLRSF
jgi:serine/threonine protein kinase/Tfp pilus assembly protein PilF